MAFTPFYMQTTGNDMNAGTTTANAADVTSTNGNWSTVTNIFTAASGTPFSAVVANTDYASIYNDGVTSGAVYIALITAVGGGGSSITLSSTIKYGTAPTTSATGRSAKVNGAHASHLPWTTLGGTIPQSTKVNIKAGTYTVAATATLNVAGTTLLPLWYSGYNTTPGDLDADRTNTLAKPLFSINSTFRLVFGSNYNILSSLSFSGSSSTRIIDFGAGSSQQEIYRCRVENTSSNAAAFAASFINSPCYVAYCWFKAPTTATTTGVVSLSVGNCSFIGCVAEGGGSGGAGWNMSNQPSDFINCVSLNSSGHGWLGSNPSRFTLLYCTIAGASGDGIKFTGTPGATAASIVGCLFSSITGIGINNASGTNTGNIARSCNDFYSCGGGNESGFGDGPAFFGQTESSNPLGSSTNFAPGRASNAAGNGFPGIFENETPVGANYCGAVQPVPSRTGGGAGFFLQ